MVHSNLYFFQDPLLDDKVYSALAYGMYGLLLFVLTMVTTICLIVFTWITPFSHYKIINMRKLISWHRDISFNSLLRSRRKINRIFQFYTQWQKSLYHRFGINDSIPSAKETLDNLYKSAETACLGGKKHPKICSLILFKGTTMRCNVLYWNEKCWIWIGLLKRVFCWNF